MKIVILGAGSLTRGQQGFTFTVVLAALVIMGVMAEVVTLSSAKQKQREIEAELLFRGMAYHNAIKSYYQSSANQQYPQRLDDLLYDERFLHRRHLRQAYSDPVTGGEWKVLLNSSGRIIGVASRSADKPLKQSGFYAPYGHLAGAKHYHEWIFIYDPKVAAGTHDIVGNR